MTDPTARIPFSDLAGFGSLFRAYCEESDRARSFYPHDWTNPDALHASADLAAAHPRNRELLVEVLREQNTRWHAKEGSLRNIERLTDPSSVAVVTGQQVGLFTGPMYTVLKTITAIQLAQAVEERTGHPCVPVFWLEGEDHDFAEAASSHIPTYDGMTTVTLEPDVASAMANTGPVGRLKLGPQIEGLIDQVERAIPQTEFRDGVITGLRETYRPDDCLRDAFAELMRRLFPDEGLVFVSPDNTRLKALLAPLFAREITDFQTSFDLLSRRSAEIEPSFPPQIHPHPMNLFMLEDEGRIRLDPVDDGAAFELRGTDRRHTAEELLAMLEDNPCRFSPNVVLRPISQDLLLPTAAYVAGPGEISYFAQLAPVYEWAGVPMPVIYPRASVTLVETRVRKALDKLEVTIPELSGDTAGIIREKTLSEMDFDLDGLLDAKTKRIESEFGEIKDLAASLDPSLVKSVESSMAGIRKQLDGVRAKLVRAAKRNHEQIGQSVQKAADGLFPGGKLQERVVSPLYYAGKYGMGMLKELESRLSLETDEHQVVDLRTRIGGVPADS